MRSCRVSAERRRALEDQQRDLDNDLKGSAKARSRIWRAHPSCSSNWVLIWKRRKSS